LTVFALKFSISVSLPKIPYLTLLDKYLLIGTAVMTALIANSALTKYR